MNTKDPTFTREGAAQVVASGNNGRRASLALSGPIAGDQLAARLSLDHFSRDSIIDYTNPDFDLGPAEEGVSVTTGRLKFLWQPSDIPGFEAKLTYAFTEARARRAKPRRSPSRTCRTTTPPSPSGT